MTMSEIDPLGRFSDRVDDYVKYRPGYPPQVLEIMKEEYGFTPWSVVADIGSGTGILTRLLLDHGNMVWGVEPNAAMRAAAEEALEDNPLFASVAASAEATSLPAGSIDFITAGQAFHWFDRARTREEFIRILKPGGWMVLVWNDRRLDTTPFLKEYEALLQRFGTDYAAVRHQDLDLAQVKEFTRSEAARMVLLDNTQMLDLDGLRGRLLSSSYTPGVGHPDREPMLRELERIFDDCQSGGRIAFEYDTKIYCSQLA